MLAVASCETGDEPATAEADQATLPVNSMEGTWRPMGEVITRGDYALTRQAWTGKLPVIVNAT